MVYDFLREGEYSHFSWSIFGKLWGLYANIAGFFGLGLVFTMVLASVSSGTGAVFKFDAPPTSEQLAMHDGVLTMRVPLGGHIEYDKHWHVTEGGCDRWMARTFIRLNTNKPYTLTLRERADPHAVGRPGTEHYISDLPIGISPGLWRYKAEAEAVCPLPSRKPPAVTLAEFDVEVYEPEGPVTVSLSKPLLARTVLPPGGPIAYTESFRRNEALQSEILFSYIQVGGERDNVFERRPAGIREAGTFRDVDVTMPLPPAVHVGKWKLRKTTITARPGGHVRTDPQWEIEFEVAK